MGRKKSVIPLGDKRLTRKQQKFVRELVSQDGLITARQAAMNAGFSPSSASSRAYEMMNPNICPHVCKEIAVYRDELDSMYQVGYKRHIAQLGRIRDLSIANSAWSAAVMAEFRRGQAQGNIYVNKSEVRHGSIDQMDRETVLEEIRKLKDAGFGKIIDVTPEPSEEEEGAQTPEHRSGALEPDQDQYSEIEDD